MLTIGQYQMLVADACSGLHSMYSLSALGTLFMYIMARREPAAQRAHARVSILPIAFVANIVRVIVAGADHLPLRRRGRAGLPARRRRDRADAGGAGCASSPSTRCSARCSRRRPRPAAWRASARLAVPQLAAQRVVASPLSCAARLRRHGRHHVGRELLLHSERPRRVVVDRRDAEQQARRESAR